MKKLFIVLFLGQSVFYFNACSNSENTPAGAGTADSAGIGDQRGKGTPYTGRDSINALRPADSMNAGRDSIHH